MYWSGFERVHDGQTYLWIFSASSSARLMHLKWNQSLQTSHSIIGPDVSCLHTQYDRCLGLLLGRGLGILAGESSCCSR